MPSPCLMKHSHSTKSLSVCVLFYWTDLSYVYLDLIQRTTGYVTVDRMRSLQYQDNKSGQNF